jgi:hypothetical protein
VPSKKCRRKYAVEWPLPQQYQQSHLLWRPWIPPSRGRACTQTRWSALTRVEPTAISRLHNSSSNRTRCHPSVDADESPPLAPLKPPLWSRVRVWAASALAPIVANEDAGAIDASSYQLFNHNQQSHVSLLWPMQAVNAAADEPSLGADRPIRCSTRRVHRYIPTSPPIRCAFSNRTHRCESHRRGHHRGHRTSHDHAIWSPTIPAIPPVLAYRLPVAPLRQRLLVQASHPLRRRALVGHGMC